MIKFTAKWLKNTLDKIEIQNKTQRAKEHPVFVFIPHTSSVDIQLISKDFLIKKNVPLSKKANSAGNLPFSSSDNKPIAIDSQTLYWILDQVSVKQTQLIEITKMIGPELVKNENGVYKIDSQVYLNQIRLPQSTKDSIMPTCLTTKQLTLGNCQYQVSLSELKEVLSNIAKISRKTFLDQSKQIHLRAKDSSLHFFAFSDQYIAHARLSAEFVLAPSQHITIADDKTAPVLPICSDTKSAPERITSFANFISDESSSAGSENKSASSNVATGDNSVSKTTSTDINSDAKSEIISEMIDSGDSSDNKSAKDGIDGAENKSEQKSVHGADLDSEPDNATGAEINSAMASIHDSENNSEKDNVPAGADNKSEQDGTISGAENKPEQKKDAVLTWGIEKNTINQILKVINNNKGASTARMLVSEDNISIVIGAGRTLFTFKLGKQNEKPLVALNLYENNADFEQTKDCFNLKPFLKKKDIKVYQELHLPVMKYKGEPILKIRKPLTKDNKDYIDLIELQIPSLN